MYHRILVPVENSSYDERILEHVRQLARFCGASIVLIHVADGWAARNIQHLNLRESEEMRGDREYIEALAAAPRPRKGSQAEALLATGDPSAEIAAAAEREHCDLIAMSTHGHRLHRRPHLRQRRERGAPHDERPRAAAARAGRRRSRRSRPRDGPTVFAPRTSDADVARPTIEPQLVDLTAPVEDYLKAIYDDRAERRRRGDERHRASARRSRPRR